MPRTELATSQMSVSQIASHWEKHLLGADKELRAPKDGTVLYLKTKVTNPFKGEVARGDKQKTARRLVSESVDHEFSKLRAGPFLASCVKSNFAELGPLRMKDLTALRDKAVEVRSHYDSFARGSAEHGAKGTYLNGARNSAAILSTIPGASSEMSPELALALYADLNRGTPSEENLEKMGALQSFYLAKQSAALDAVDRLPISKVETVANTIGAQSIRPSPQSIFLRQIGNKEDLGGRCEPLTMLAILEEAAVPRGADRMLQKFEDNAQGVRTSGAKVRTELSRDLAHLHGVTAGTRTTIRDAEDRVISSPGHRTMVSHLATNPGIGAGPVFYAIESDIHAMMIGRTRHAGVDSFVFYDPDFGVARFETAEKMTQFLDKYFGELGYGQSGMKNLGDAGFKMARVSQVNVETLTPMVGASLRV